MTLNRVVGITNVLIGVALLAVLAPGKAVTEASELSGPIDLGTLGGTTSTAIAMNDRGVVVGLSLIAADASTHAFAWTEDSGMVDIGTFGGASSVAFQVNHDGLVAGQAQTAAGPLHAFAWTFDGGIVDLGTLGGPTSSARDVNSQGMVTGNSAVADGQTHAFAWTALGGMIDLGTLGGSRSSATCINDNGVILGTSDIAGDTARHMFAWTEQGGMVDLGSLDGNFVVFAPNILDHQINSHNVVAGTSTTSGGQQRAVRWTSEAGLLDLGTLGGSHSFSASINDGGMIVGSSSLAGDSVFNAFAWTEADGMIDLGALGAAGSDALSVNNNGVVVGVSRNASGNAVPFRWTREGGMVALETLGGSTGTAFYVNECGDAAGNSRVAGDTATHATLWPSDGGCGDTTAPTVTVDAPSATSYLLNQVVMAQYVCDDETGIALCEGTAASGAAIDTASVGTSQFAVNAADTSGNTASVSVSYSVVFASTGECHGDAGHEMLSPLRSDGSSVFRAGRTIPVKFRVCDANGVSIGAPVIASFVQVEPAVAPANAECKWREDTEQWMCSLDTTSLAPATYRYRIGLIDSSTIDVRFRLR